MSATLSALEARADTFTALRRDTHMLRLLLPFVLPPFVLFERTMPLRCTPSEVTPNFGAAARSTLNRGAAPKRAVTA